LPSDAEWTILTEYLGGKEVAGGKLKEAGTTHWQSPNTGADNSSGFTAFPSGYRGSSNGNFYNLGVSTYFWSASEYGATYAGARYLLYVSSGVDRYGLDKSAGFSVRCVRDN